MDLRERVQAAAKATPKHKAKKVWEQPTLDDFATGEVLAMDQTYSHTGWCHFSLYDGKVEIHGKGTLNEAAVEGLTGHDANLQRSVWMGQRIDGVFSGIGQGCIISGDAFPRVVCERPPVQGYRPESILLAAQSVWLSTIKWSGKPRPVLVSTDHMKAVLCPPGERLEKRHVKAALVRLGLPVATGWNEHNRDALALGLTHLWDLKRAT